MPKKKKTKRKQKKRNIPKSASKIKPIHQRDNNAPQFVNLGLKHHKAGQLAQAEELYQKAVSMDPNNADAHHFLGIIANQAGKIDQAVQLIQKAVSINSYFMEAHFNLGLALEKLNQLDEAISSYEKAVSLKSDYTEALLRLGNIFLRQNQGEKAITCLKKVVLLHPNHIGAHFSLGVALEKTNQADEAVSSYKKAVKLKPGLFEALNNLGNILNRQGEFNDAIVLYNKALAVRKDYPDIYNNLGVALKRTGRLKDAMECFETAISLKPDYAEAHNNLGNMLEKAGHSEAAMAQYQKALTIEPGYAQAHYNLGVEIEKSGRLKEGAVYLRKAISLDPEYAEAHRHLSNSTVHSSYDDDIRTMESLYVKDNLPPEDKMHLAFGLGKAFSDLKKYEKAFEFIFEANRLKRSRFEYAISDDQTLFGKIKETFAKDFISSHHDWGYDDETPVFILGMPRSGTTLVEQILATHPLVYGAGELDNLSTVFFTLAPKGSSIKDILGHSSTDFKRAGQDYIKRIRAHSDTAIRITDKMPHNFLFVGLIRVILPKAKVIHCMRDPMDTCFSIYKNLFHQQGSHRYAYDLTELGQYYRLYLDLAEHWRQTLPGFMHEISYESLIGEQEAETKKLLDFCDLTWDDNCLAFHKTRRKVATTSSLQVRKPIYKDSIRLWKQYEPWLSPLKKELL